MPCLSNNSVKAFAKQIVSYHMYQVRVGSAVHDRQCSLQWINQIGVLIFLVKVVWKLGIQDDVGTLVLSVP